MARLEGVKTLDMVDGQITKVEYDGAVYEKVDESASEGDIVQVIAESWGYIERGAFYRAIKTVEYDDGDRFTRIEFPTGASGFESDFAVFRKVTAPTIESVNAKVDVVSEQVSTLAERVDALEGEKQAEETTPTIKEGNRVKALTDGQFYDIEAGEIGEVTNIDAGLSDDDPYSIRVDIEDDHDYFRPQDLELVTEDDEEETERPTVGDVVKVVRDESGHRAKIGDVVTIVEDEHDDHPYKCKFLDGTHAGWFYESEVEKISEDKTAETITFEGAEYTLVDRKAQPGDVVVFTESRVSWVKNEKPYGPVNDSYEFIDEHGEHLALYRPEYGRTPENTKVYAPVVYAPKSGDIVVITGNTNASRNAVGDIGKVGKVDSDGIAVVDVPGKTEGSGNWTKFSEMRPATDEEKAQYEQALKPMLKVGGTVKLNVKGTPKFGWGDVSNGEVGVIKEEGSDGRMYVDFPSQKSWMADPSELVLTTVEEAKRAAKFAKIGRKPGEIKKGDIVRYKWTREKQHAEGIAEVQRGPVGPVGGGNYYLDNGDDVTLGKHLELIAPVESRVDIQ